MTGSRSAKFPGPGVAWRMARRSPGRLQTSLVAPLRRRVSKQGEKYMGDKGKKDKGGREAQKKALLTPKEKRKLKQEKKNK